MPGSNARILLLIGMAFALSQGETNAPERAAPETQAAAEAPAVHPEEVIDLDFTDDFPARPGAKPRAGIRSRGRKVEPAGAGEARTGPQAPRLAASPEPARAWLYWAMGISTLAGVAGGAIWYLHADESRPAAPVRNKQVFSDAVE
jgi:hypothetical protein